MTNSTNLALPYIAAAQAQKHITHNEAVRALDVIVQLSVLDRDLTEPPGAPGDGERYIPASGASGAWAGKDLNIAAWQDGAWAFFAPRAGWLAWIADEQVLLVWDGSGWQGASAVAGVNPVSGGLLGVNATADTTNRLSVSSSAVLFNHATGDVRVNLNKQDADDTAAFIFQTGFSARAEIGTLGSDDFVFKVSPDGATFHESFRIACTSGECRFEQPVALKPYSVAALPGAGTPGALIWVYDEADGATAAYADGITWRRMRDGVAVS
jgi:hypothetical protein